MNIMAQTRMIVAIFWGRESIEGARGFLCWHFGSRAFWVGLADTVCSAMVGYARGRVLEARSQNMCRHALPQ